MKDRMFSTCEKNFILAALLENRRLDGRDLMEFRDVSITFGTEYGSSYVTLGETSVLGQVIYEIEEPKSNKPNEGLLFVNVEINGMAAPNVETGKQNQAIKLSRLVEKGIKESNCVDLEALCVVAEDKVWVLRIDLMVLNDDGNLMSCCSLAALASLLSTCLPQITVEEKKDIVIHSPKEKNPIPLCINHFPVAVTFSLYHNGLVAVADPTSYEEKVQDSELIYYMNSYRELCGIHFGGMPVQNEDILMRCATQATRFADKLVKYIKLASEDDNVQRKDLMSMVPGFVKCINVDRLLGSSQDRTAIKVPLTAEDEEPFNQPIDENGQDVERLLQEISVKTDSQGTGFLNATTAAFGENWMPAGGETSWNQDSGSSDVSDDSGEEEEEESEDDDDYDEVEVVKTITEKDRIIDNIELGDSEEEETTVLEGHEVEQR